jgi:hypothetical protein
VLRTSFCFWAIFSLGCASLFWPGLYSSEVPVFRDAFHFYYPQAVWLDQCALQGEYFPLWQCNESLGVDLAGETTSALYYPLRFIWLLPSLSVAQRFAAFVLIHLLLAGLGIQYACARMQLRREAGWLAGACFALSCPVLFQHNNLAYLSSAAWLGFAIAEIARWLERSDLDACRPRVVVMSGAIAMMVLAGDPHTAVNLLIVAVLLAAAQAISKRSAVWFGKSMGWLTMVVLLAVGLSAVQSCQSLHWAKQSQRWSNNSVVDDSPFVHAEQATAPENAVPIQVADIMNEPVRRSASAIYEFSLSPWHVLTGLWPTLGGEFSPENSRTFSLFRAEGRMWIPSLFFGVVPLLLLLGGFRSCANPKYTFFMLAALFALLASFGNYSLGWLIRSVFDIFDVRALSEHLPSDHYSSFYGLLAEWLPGYRVFRYPAKWSVLVVAFAILAAATRFDQLKTADLLRVTSLQRIVLLISGLGLLFALTCGGLFEKYVSTRSAELSDVWLGTPNSSAMTRQLWIAFLIPILVVGLMALVRWREQKLKQGLSKTQLPVHAILAWIGLLETLIVATCWCSFIPCMPSKAAGPWTSEFVWADASEANIGLDQWLADTTDKSAMGIADYQQTFSLGKLGLLSNQHNLASILTIEPQRIKQLRSGLTLLDDLSAAQPELDAALAWLGVEKRLIRWREDGMPASFRWQAIPETKPLCELRCDNAGNSQSAFVVWKWTQCGRLEIEVDSPTRCRLLVRQYNDDGWKIVTDKQASPQLTRDSTGLFIECAIEAGKSRLVLQRIMWPRWAGLNVSILSLLIAVTISTWRKFSCR